MLLAKCHVIGHRLDRRECTSRGLDGRQQVCLPQQTDRGLLHEVLSSYSRMRRRISISALIVYDGGCWEANIVLYRIKLLYEESNRLNRRFASHCAARCLSLLRGTRLGYIKV